MQPSRRFADSDEGRHVEVATEAWWFWGHSTDAATGVFVGLELRGNSFDYWAGLVRVGEPYLYIAELNGIGLRGGLEIKPPEMWADHQCDVPMRQWSIGNEAHGVLLDDPTEAWRRGFGTPVPVTFDIEWYAVGEPMAIDHGADQLGQVGGDEQPGGINGFPQAGDVSGYQQAGEIDARIELTEGVLAITGPGHRAHVWGGPYLPTSYAMPVAGDGLRAPYRRSDGVVVDQVLGAAGWLGRTSGRTAGRPDSRTGGAGAPTVAP